MMASSWSMSAAMLRGVLVGHAHLGFQPQARQRRAQVVRDAGQHHGAVLLDLGQLRAMRLKPMLTSRISLVTVFSSRRRIEVAVAHAAGGERQLLERPVDQPRDRAPSRSSVASAR